MKRGTRNTLWTLAAGTLTLYALSYFMCVKPVFIGSQDTDWFTPSYDLQIYKGGLYGQGPIACAYLPIHVIDRALLRYDYWHIRSLEHAITRHIYVW